MFLQALHLKQNCVTLTTTHSYEKWNFTIHINMMQKNSNFSETGSHFMEKMSSGFPSDVLRLLCLSAAFYLAELSSTTTCCCSRSLQAADMLLSGTSVNHRGKTRGHFVCKIERRSHACLLPGRATLILKKIWTVVNGEVCVCVCVRERERERWDTAKTQDVLIMCCG